MIGNGLIEPFSIRRTITNLRHIKFPEALHLFSQLTIFCPFDILISMSQLLEEAIETLRELPEEEQDAAADALFAYISSDERQYHLRSDQAEEVRRTLRDLKSGKTRLATDAEVAELKKRAHL